MKFNRLCGALLLSVVVSACSSDGEQRPEYLDSTSIQNLEIPPQLSRPNTAAALKIPKPSAKALDKLKDQQVAEGQVSPLFKGLQLESEAGLYWLSVDQDADKLWPMLIDFWANEGIKITRQEALLGFMDTEWVKEYQLVKDGNSVTKWLNSFSTDQLDKFRMRVERIAKNKSRIYVSHRGLELKLQEDGTSWEVRPSDVILEHEMLKRLELFAGLSQAKVERLFDDYKPYQSRVRKTDQANQYEILGRQDFVWRRLQHGLDRLGAEIIKQDKEKFFVDIRVGEISAENRVDTKDELSESSWLLKLFTVDESKQAPVEIHLQIRGNNKTSLLTFSFVNGKPIINGLAESFRNSLLKLLK